MITGGTGGANTQVGLAFEGKVGLKQAIDGHPDFHLNGNRVLRDSDNSEVALVGEKYEFYRVFLRPNGQHPVRDGVLSRRLLPDGFVVPEGSDVVSIIEIKWQTTPGSVDEKLQTCVYKKDRYDAMLAPLGKVSKMVYVVNEDWFGKPEYRDTLKFMRDNGTVVCFDELPLDVVGIS
jgi:hypothetical protein